MRSSRRRSAISLPGRLVGKLKWTALERKAYYVVPPPAIAQSFPDLKAL